MNLNLIWTTLEDSYNGFNNISFEGSMNTIAELNLPSDWFIWLVAVMFFGAEPISSKQFMNALPYGWADALEKRFASAAKQGYLIADGKGGYHPTEKGAEAVKRMIRADSDVVSPLKPLSEENSQSLLDYLIRIADASLSASEPPAKFIISHKRNFMHPGKNASRNVLIVQYLNELEGYRTDSHSATWQVYNIEGHTWDIFTCLWRNGTSPFDKLFEKLQYNEVPENVYTQDLLELMKRGWINEVSGEYQVTVEGKKIRDDAETLTEQYFFASWACLNTTEQADLMNLATQLSNGLQNPKAEL